MKIEILVPVQKTKSGYRPKIQELNAGWGWTAIYVKKNEYGNYQKIANGETPAGCILTITEAEDATAIRPVAEKIMEAI